MEPINNPDLFKRTPETDFIPLNNPSTSLKNFDPRGSTASNQWRPNFRHPDRGYPRHPYDYSAPRRFPPRFQRPSPYGDRNFGFNQHRHQRFPPKQSYFNVPGQQMPQHNRFQRPPFKHDISVYVPDSAFEDPWADFVQTTAQSETAESCSSSAINADDNLSKS